MNVLSVTKDLSYKSIWKLIFKTHTTLIHKEPTARRVFRNKTDLENNMGNKPLLMPLKHECEFCQKRFDSQTTLWAHLVEHGVSPIMYECALCNKGFVLQVDLEAHLKTHTAIIQKEHTITKNHNSNLILIPPSHSANSSNNKVE